MTKGSVLGVLALAAAWLLSGLFLFLTPIVGRSASWLPKNSYLLDHQVHESHTYWKTLFVNVMFDARHNLEKFIHLVSKMRPQYRIFLVGWLLYKSDHFLGVFRKFCSFWRSVNWNYKKPKTNKVLERYKTTNEVQNWNIHRLDGLQLRSGVSPQVMFLLTSEAVQSK